MNLSEYIKKVAWTNIDYDWVYGSQCVDLIKNYTREVLWIRLWTFWGSAKTGWANSSNTFPTDTWEKIPNNPSDLYQTPKVWDIAFWNTWIYGHVAIVLEWTKWSYIQALEQNVWNWDWVWEDDAVKVSRKSYHNISWWYRLKNTDIKDLQKENKRLNEENAILEMQINAIKKIVE